MGTKDRKSKEKESRYQAILAAAEKIIGVQGLHGLSRDLVAREAELTKGTLYLYFDSKDAATVMRSSFAADEKH